MIIPNPIALPEQAVTIVKPRSRAGHLVEGIVSSATYWAAPEGDGRWIYVVTYLCGNGRYATARVLSDKGIRRGGMTAAEKEQSKP